MDRFVTRETSAAAEALPSYRRFTWKHALTQVRGRMDSYHKQALLRSMLCSFSEIGSFSQVLNNQGMRPSIAEHGFNSPYNQSSQFLRRGLPQALHRPHISGLEFDSKGVYLASVTNTGCLGIHDYESLYCHAKGSNMGSITPVVQLLVCPRLEAVCWNPANEDEVACVAAWSGKLYCYDISLVTDNPSQVLKVSTSRDKVESAGLLDIAFCNTHVKRVTACGKQGEMYVWDCRASITPQLVFSSEQQEHLNSLAMSLDEQVIYAGSASGQLLVWDLRGGKNSTAFMAPGRVYNPPFTTWKVASLLEQIPSLRAQTVIEMSGIQSICLNHFCEQQLAFHLNNGWSGVLDLSTLEVTHIHCPPPPWFYDEGQGERGQANYDPLLRRKPTWLSAHSIYACPSLASPKINLLDFKLGPSSPHYVKESGDDSPTAIAKIPTSEFVMACAAHPLNDNIVAGTNGANLLVFDQRGNQLEVDDREKQFDIQET